MDVGNADMLVIMGGYGCYKTTTAINYALRRMENGTEKAVYFSLDGESREEIAAKFVAHIATSMIMARPMERTAAHACAMRIFSRLPLAVYDETDGVTWDRVKALTHDAIHGGATLIIFDTVHGIVFDATIPAYDHLRTYVNDMGDLMVRYPGTRYIAVAHEPTAPASCGDVVKRYSGSNRLIAMAYCVLRSRCDGTTEAIKSRDGVDGISRRAFVYPLA
jgi:hypothetical protein